ncbi:small integral membrane protein 8-like isoform X2 [Dinothrombium tinctorium]|uniref:Small integral membrane protein 8 n=1 Tax=Dinothrombium tinctorium TaxID=1965070 RepID=A0A443RBJ0_9ACAR|nr:small integral membrane protein 8-like isoform X2 [Dinothrombium tinctorium]RWS12648.1 small integral membrane protein 8-like isoform X2 [Dinothrombium tinctorium]
MRSNETKTGIRGMDATTLFKITNFELFAKPNKYVMGAGLVAITSSLCYLAYFNWINRDLKSSENYVAVSEDGSEILRKRSSRWD